MEAVVRFHYSLPMIHEPGFGWVIRPGSVRWGREGRATSHWSSHGIRGTSEPDLSGRAILVLGNSVTEALQVSDDDVFTTILEHNLNATGIHRPVLNAGRSGVSAAEYVAFAERNRSLYRPHWVVVELMPDDLGPHTWDPIRSSFAWSPDARLTVRPRLVRESTGIRAFGSQLAASSMLFVYGAYRVSEFRQAFADEPPLFMAASSKPRSTPNAHPVLPAGANGPDPVPPCPGPDGTSAACPIEAELDLIRHAYGDRVTFLIVPLLDFHKPESVSPIEARINAHCASARLSCVNVRSGYSDLVRRGLSPFGFPNTAFNDGHMNSNGHRLAAQALTVEVKRLSANGLL